MDLFADGIHVRLRSRVHGTYLHADDDGIGVSLRPRGYDPPLAGVWRVHRVQRHGIDYVLLHGAAYGRYLALLPGEPAPRWCRGKCAVQRGYDDPEQDAVMWRPARTDGGRGDYVLMRHVYNGTLRANGRFRIWNNGVSIDEYFGTRSTMRHWVVEVVPPRQGPPPLPVPSTPNLGGCSILFWRCNKEEPEASRRRRIRYLRSDQPLNFGQANLPAFCFYGRSVLNLRTQVGIRANEGEVFGTRMCVQAGLYGRLTPLVTDLHHSEEPMNIVVYTAGAPDAEALVYPDADAQGP
ncbi:hypothetical protein SETIT_4G053200v2 [Setaria italica]|uniref:Uncharacterized protein n=1 Tax=Setaria italica TaxID=4555 RepID=A0A368QQZ9_SETIT|nr:uncharacterized protein LOC111257010 [Setaria italica]RCV20397.1 hypothetical protein SETIT_4G053200v2 [Setaria italica]